MKNKKTIVILTTSIIVIGVIFLAIKKANEKDVFNDPKLKADYDSIIKKIDNAKK